VYRFINPYDNKPTYIVFDFKSLAESSISSATINPALRNMAHTIDCSMVSEQWKDYFLQDTCEVDILGCLMVYNHDGTYSKNMASQIYPNLYKNWPDLQPHHEILILDPETLVYLNSIYTDIRMQQGEMLPSDKELRGFFQPDLQLQYHKKANQKQYEVPILPDQLKAPFQIMRYEVEEKGKEGYMIFYRGKGVTSEEFIYLIDYLFNYQIIDHASLINLRLPYAESEAPNKFKLAIQEYSKIVAPSEAVAKDIVKRLKCMEMESIDRVVPKFLVTELGMGME